MLYYAQAASVNVFYLVQHHSLMNIYHITKLLIINWYFYYRKIYSNLFPAELSYCLACSNVLRDYFTNFNAVYFPPLVSIGSYYTYHPLVAIGTCLLWNTVVRCAPWLSLKNVRECTQWRRDVITTS